MDIPWVFLNKNVYNFMLCQIFFTNKYILHKDEVHVSDHLKNLMASTAEFALAKLKNGFKQKGVF